MEIPKVNANRNSTFNKAKSWSPKNTWECSLECGIVTLNPCNKKVDTCTDPEAIVAMLQTCHSVEENQSGNYTVRFNYGKGRIENTVFVGGCRNTPEADVLAMLHAVQVGDVFAPQTAEEAISAWGVAA